MIEFSMTNHSADPNQRYLARIRKLIHFYGTDPENCISTMNRSKIIYFYGTESGFMLKLTTLEEKSYFTSIYGTRIRTFSMRIRKSLMRIRNYFIQNARIRNPALVQITTRYLKNLEEWLLFLGMVRYLTKNARIRIYRYGTDGTLRYRNQFSV
jgi:hypothetical protein